MRENTKLWRITRTSTAEVYLTQEEIEELLKEESVVKVEKVEKIYSDYHSK